MAELIHEALRYSHISLGFAGLVAFWVPVMAKKGGRLHIWCGKVFATCGYVVAITAIASCGWMLIHPASWSGKPITLGDVPLNQIMFIAILAFLRTLLLKGLETGLAVIRTRRKPEALDSFRLRAVYWLEGASGAALFAFGAACLALGKGALFAIPLVLGVVGVQEFRSDRKFLAEPRPTPMAWWYKHMEAMIGNGVAFHTAFLVFGVRGVIGGVLEGPLALVPWLLPTAIAIPALHFWVRSYKRKFGEMPKEHAAPAVSQPVV